MSQIVNKGPETKSISEKHPPASLYVGDLAPTVTEAHLYEHFLNAGPVASIRICRFNPDRRSNGYAYVNFQDAKDAERALEILNHSEIQGKPCRIMWQIRDPSMRRSGLGNLFVKNLPLDVGPKDLSDAFSPFGDILSTKIATDESRKSKGFGFVHFAVPAAANAAMAAFEQGKIRFRSALPAQTPASPTPTPAAQPAQGKKKGKGQAAPEPTPAPPQPAVPEPIVSPFIPKKERLQKRALTWTNVFVKNLHNTVTDQMLNEMFSKYGKITSGVVMKNEDGTSRCFGFVNFDSHEAATTAAQEMHEQIIQGRKLWCGPAQKKSERLMELEKQRKLSKGTNLYLKNFDDDLTEEKLRQYFTKEAFGEIKSVKIMTDDKGNSRGFGFISFGTSPGTATALNEMNGRPLPGSRKPLYVAYHEPKAIRQRKLALRFANSRYPKSRPPNAMPTMGYPPNVYYQNQYPVYAQPAVNPRRTWPHPYPVQQMQPYQAQPPMQNRAPKASRPPQAQGQAPLTQQPIKRGGAPRKMHMIQTESGEVPLTSGTLAKYPEEQQRLLLGERLYPIIQKTQPTLAGKITGMLLDSGWKIEDLLTLLYDEDKLNEKVADAAAILEKVNPTNQ